MTPECTFTLPNGRKCRGLAGRNQPFCRHHRAKNPGHRPIPRNDRYSPLARWRAAGQELPHLRVAELRSLVYELLDALTQPGQAPSDRTVGRFLRTALTRLGQVPFPYPDHESAPQQPFSSAPAPVASALPEARPGDLAQLQREMETLFATLAEAQPR
jgi:hypothetical protein